MTRHLCCRAHNLSRHIESSHRFHNRFQPSKGLTSVSMFLLKCINKPYAQ